MTTQDLWVLSPEISIALLALIVISLDLVKRSTRTVSTIALVGLAAPLILTLNLWFGWFGFNAGSSLASDGSAANAFVQTNTAAAMAAVVWMPFAPQREGWPSKRTRKGRSGILSMSPGTL